MVARLPSPRSPTVAGRPEDGPGSSDAVVAGADLDATESYQELLARASHRAGARLAPHLVRHVLRVSEGTDWPTRTEAMDALLRRLAFGHRDELLVAARPRDRTVLGSYQTRRKRSSARPYRTVLASLDPLRASCDCPDFLRSSLGVCKHALCVLEDLAAKPRQFEKALRESATARPSPGPRWHPVRPLEGEGDLLAQVRWEPGPADRRRVARRWFAGNPTTGLVPRARVLADPAQRERMVKDLLRAARQRASTRAAHDPALERLLALEKERLERIAGQKIDGRRLRAILRTLRRKLYLYQKEGVERFLASGRLLLADDMGLGKTAQAIASCHVLWRLERVRRGLLIVPASLKSQWAREWRAFCDTPVAVVDGDPLSRAAGYRKTRRGFLIVNYEQVLRDLDHIRAWNPHVVVLDEAQRIKNWATKTAFCVKSLRPKYRLVLTGTPMENRLDELASIFDWVDDFALEPKWRLTPWHTTSADGHRGISGARHLDTLRARLGSSMLRRVRAEVLTQLPPRTDVRVPVDMTEEQRDEHDALIQPISSLLHRARKRPLTQAEFLKLMQLLTTQRIISNGLAQLRFDEVWPGVESRRPSDTLLRSLASPKLLELRELVARLVVDQERKVIVFSQWRRMLKLAGWAISDILAELGLSAVFFTGHEGQKRRTQNVVEFHDDPSVRVFLASDAGGVGLNLQRAANCCINLELPWNPAVLEQRIGRIHRLGQKRPIDVYNIVCEEGIENRIASIVGTKQALFRGLFDGKSDSVEFEKAGTFLEKIEKVVLAPELPGSRAAEGKVAEDTAAPPADERVEEPLDDSSDEPLDATAEEREIDEILELADESTDTSTPSPDETIAASGESAAGSTPTEHPSGPARVPMTSRPGSPSSTVQELFSKLNVTPQGDGGIRIEAPPEAAGLLGDLFAGMARLLQQASAGSSPEARACETREKPRASRS